MPGATGIAALLAILALPAAAEGTGALRLLDLSARLYARGLEGGDALMVAAAAKLRREAGAMPGLPLDGPAMLETARALAAGDAALAGLVDDIAAEREKGVAAGPEYRLAALGPGAVETLPAMAFRGGEYAEAYVEAAPGNDLNLTVRDDKGRLVCSDTDASHVAYCGWTPAVDGRFTLSILNAGDSAADYALMTN